MRFLALDPGAATGWAWFEDAMPVEMGELQVDDFMEWLPQQSPELFVVEDYIIRPGGVNHNYQHQWNRGVPLQVIGMIKLYAHNKAIPIEFQQPSIKPVAAAIFSMPNKGKHMHDAVLHGKWWWHKNMANSPT